MIKDEILDGNKKTINNVKLVLQKDYSRLKRRTACEPVKEELQDQGSVKEMLTLGENKNLFLIGASCLPSLCNISLATIGTICGSAALITLLLNVGYKGTIQEMQIMSEIESFAVKMGTFAKDKFTDAAKFTLLPITFSLATLPSGLVRKQKKAALEKEHDRRIQNYNQNISKAISKDETITLIEDIEQNRKDSSLVFIKDFLRNVDLRANKEEYNIELLSKMADYRATYLKYERKEANKDELDFSFMEIINILKNASVCNGASVFFKKDPYVASLLATYTDKEEKTVSGFKREESEKLVKKYC